ncbi:Protein F09B12.3, partial [Aphelenchoides avenae]
VVNAARYYSDESISEEVDKYERNFVSFKNRLRNTYSEGKDEDYTYKSVCVVDGVPKVLDGFDCRNQVAVGRFKNSINATG